MGYDASSIRVLQDSEVAERFSFARAAAVAARYPHVAPECVARLLEACELSGASKDEAIRRYLDGDKSVVVAPDLLVVYEELMAESRRLASRKRK